MKEGDGTLGYAGCQPQSLLSMGQSYPSWGSPPCLQGPPAAKTGFLPGRVGAWSSPALLLVCSLLPAPTSRTVSLGDPVHGRAHGYEAWSPGHDVSTSHPDRLKGAPDPRSNPVEVWGGCQGQWGQLRSHGHESPQLLSSNFPAPHAHTLPSSQPLQPPMANEEARHGDLPWAKGGAPWSSGDWCQRPATERGPQRLRGGWVPSPGLSGQSGGGETSHASVRVLPSQSLGLYGPSQRLSRP